MTAERTTKSQPLQKGLACSTCKARKVKCDAVHPVCGACVRSSRFEGREPQDCVYKGLQGRRKGRNGRRNASSSVKSDESSCCSSSTSSDHEHEHEASEHVARFTSTLTSAAPSSSAPPSAPVFHKQRTASTSLSAPNLSHLPPASSAKGMSTYPQQHLLLSLPLPPAPVVDGLLPTWPALLQQNMWYDSMSMASDLPEQQQSYTNTPELDSATWSDLSGSPTESLFDEPLFSSSPASASSLASPFSWFAPTTIPSTVPAAVGYMDPTLSLPMLPPLTPGYNTFGAKSEEPYWPTTPSVDVVNNLTFSPFSMA
ncbi:hypothetical protein ACM66B_001689 [Microbotryomycetes sp. NB124-2]